MPRINRVMLVGHCGFDAGNIRRAVEDADDSVQITEAHRASDAREAGPDTLLLINRQLGGGFGVHEGVELIRELSAKPNPPAMMLVTNFADVQQEAVDAGALPGFGKSSLGSAATRDRLREAIGSA